MSNDENTLFAGSSPAKRTNFVNMKNILWLLLGAGILAGCMHNYDITLINGNRITHVTKPKLDKSTGVYTYKDVKGRTNYVNASRVVEIAPHSTAPEPGTPQ
jgi:hypothetical protein